MFESDLSHPLTVSLAKDEEIEIERAPLEIISGDCIENLKAKCTNCPGTMTTQFWGGHGNTFKCKSCGHLRTIRAGEREAITTALYPLYCGHCLEHLEKCEVCDKGFTANRKRVICHNEMHFCSKECARSDEDNTDSSDDDFDDEEESEECHARHGIIANTYTKDQAELIRDTRKKAAEAKQAALKAISVDTCAGPWGPYCMGMNSFSHKDVFHQDGTTGVVHLVLRQVKGEKNECIQKRVGVVVVESKYAIPICLRNCPWCGGNIKDDGNGPEKKGWN